MWKYVSRRIRDTFERSANHFDKRSTTGIANSPNGNFSDDKNKQATPCRWFSTRKCWNSFNTDNNTNNKRWNFEQLHSSWISAITWSSALVLGWYASQLVHLKHKYRYKEHKSCSSLSNIFSSLHPYVTYVDKNAVYFNSVSKIEKVIQLFTPTVHLISNKQKGSNKERNSTDVSSTSPDTSNNELGDVLNSIENRLGLAAIENGQHKDGLNLLRSAANRNHAPALYNLGLCHELGLGVPVDEKMAMELYRSAAALEHPGALYNLGIYYGQGRGGLTRDIETATRLLRLAAVQGQEEAIKALKALDTDATESSSNDDMNWSYPTCAQDENIVPSHTTLFVENVNFLQAQGHEAAVY